MLYILVALFFFLDAIFIHLALCRRKGEGLFLKLFLGIACANLTFVWFVFFLLSRQYGGGQESFWLAPLYGTATAIYVLLMPTYLVFYFSTEQVSPSKKILLLLSQNGPMSADELTVHFSNEVLVFPRIQDLLVTGCVLEHGGWYVLTPPGFQMAKLYEIYQSILGRAKGG